jgi:hypothetical protein
LAENKKEGGEEKKKGEGEENCAKPEKKGVISDQGKILAKYRGGY